MRTIKFIFVSPDGIVHNIIGAPVKLVTKSRYAHVAVQFDDHVYESIAPKICIQEWGKYDNEQNKYVVEVNVTDEEYDMAHSMAFSLLKTYYGLDDCAIGAIRDVLGKDVSKYFANFDSDKTLDCSAYATIIARTFAEILPDHKHSEITPERLLTAISEEAVKRSGRY